MKHFLTKSALLLAMIFSFANLPLTAMAAQVQNLNPGDNSTQNSSVYNTDVFSGSNTAGLPTENCRYFIGMPSWDCHTTNIDSQDKLVQNVGVIASNILTDLTVLVTYLVIGYVIYGGYLYMFSAGDPGKAAAGKRTLTHAFIGLGISMTASIIVNSIRIALIGAGGQLGNCTVGVGCTTGGELVNNLLQWVIGVSGLVCAIFVVVGAVGYMTSAGDSSKLQKAKNTLTYALIGLAIVALAEVITAFVSNTVKDAEKSTSFLPNNSQIINQKEIS